MEVGTIRQSSQNAEIDESEGFRRPKIYDHNRTWKFISTDSLFKQSSSLYILSVDAGCGKTTFLRYMQAQLLKDGKFTAVFLDAFQLEKWNAEKDFDFVEMLANHVKMTISADRVKGFLGRFLKENIILLIDGLDQIKTGGSEYESLADQVLASMGKNVIMASRPSAVLNLENNNKYTFLRLLPFDINDQKNYFKDKFERARQLSQKAPHLIAIPMLAQMVRTLIEDKQDQGINNRTELYEKFINHIFMEYRHGKTKLSPDERTLIRQNLRKIAYDALAKKEPDIQIIPLDICYDKIHFAIVGKYGEFLAKSGLVNLIVDRSEGKNKDSLFFTHQSFQEYLAAEYVAKDDDRVQKVLSEKWNPKWKEVIKFLAGIKGQEIIQNVFEEKDNCINSNLCLCAELVPETNLDAELEDKIWQKAKKIFDRPINRRNLKYLAFVNLNSVYVIDKLVADLSHGNFQVLFAFVELKDKIDCKIVNTIADMLSREEFFYRRAATFAVGGLKEKVDKNTLYKIAALLENNNPDIRLSAIETLNGISDKLDTNLVNKIGAMLDDSDVYVRSSALEILGKLANTLDVKLIARITSKLFDAEEIVRDSAATAIRKLKDKEIKIIITKLVDMLRDKNPRARSLAADALGRFENKVDNNIVNELANLLYDKDPYVRCSAVKALGKVHNKVDENLAIKMVNMLNDTNRVVRCYSAHALCELKDKIAEPLITKLADLLCDNDPFVRCSAVITLGKLNDKVDRSIVTKIGNMLNDINEKVRRYSANTLKQLKDKVDKIIVIKLANSLYDKDPYVRCSAVEALGSLNNILDTNLVTKMADMLNDEYGNVRSSTIDALGNLGHKLNQNLLNKVIDMLSDNNANARSSATEALGKLTDTLDANLLNKMVDMLSHKEVYVCKSVEDCLCLLINKLDRQMIKKIATCKDYCAVHLLELLYRRGKLEFLTNQ
jgi:HEAT repeat protein